MEGALNRESSAVPEAQSSALLRGPVASPKKCTESVAEIGEAASPGGNEKSQLSPFEMLVQGLEQQINIPLKTILMEIMKKMPAKEAPVFKCTSYGSDSFEVTIDLNVTGSRMTVEPLVTVATVHGDVSSLPQLSLISALKKAFDYLEEKHFVQVHDYSMKVVERYDCKCVLVDVNSVAYNLDKVLADWIVVIDSVGKFQCELESNVHYETNHGVRSAAGDIYAESKDFVESLASKYIEKHRAMYLEFREYQGIRDRYLRNAIDKINKYRMKGYRQVLNFSEKHVLSSVLNHLGLKPAEYNNRPDKYGQFDGEVIINLPVIEDARCGGRTKFSGGVRSSAAEAEEDAAGKALRYMEKNLNFAIVDINYAERLEAEANHDTMVKLLRSMVGLARKVLNYWSTMNEHMDAGVDIFGEHRTSFSMTPLSPVEVAALKFCQDGFVKVHAECSDGYEAAMEKLKGLDKYKIRSGESEY
ncbi:unnamed protein product [Urochloa humidicola]